MQAAYLDMVPWLVFLLVERKDGPGIVGASVCALGAAAGITALARWRRRPAPLARVGCGLFSAFTTVGWLDQSWIHNFAVARGVSLLVLAAVLLGSLVRSPLSAAFASDLVPSRICSTPAFRRVNAEMTASWGIGAAVGGAANLLLSATSTTGWTLTAFGWLVPLLVGIVALAWGQDRWQCMVDASSAGEGGFHLLVAAPRPGADTAPGVVIPFAKARRQRPT